MGTCNSNKLNENSHHMKKNGSNCSIISIQTQLQINYLSDLTIKEDVSSDYEIGESLGRGNYGIVREAINKNTKAIFAIKTIPRNKFDLDKLIFLKQEIEISLEVKHDNIIKCHKVYEDAHYIHFVFDYIKGADLFDYIIQLGSNLTEFQAALIFSQILDALHYLHNNNIVHRDIKLENFLIINEDSKLKVKLIDFGFAAKKNHLPFRDKIGSLSYLAPEFFTEMTYDINVDIWSAGIVLFNMLTGKQPFSYNNESEIISEIVNKEVSFDDILWANISTECKELIILLLKKNPSERINAFQARNHRWFQKIIIEDNNPTIRVEFQPRPENIEEILNNISIQSKIKNEVISSLMNNDLIINFDTILNNILQKSVSQSGLSKYMISMYEILESICAVCSDQILKNKLNNLMTQKKKTLELSMIDYDDFFKSLKKRKDLIKKEKLWALFKTSDNENKGYLNILQIERLLKNKFKNFEKDNIREILRMNLIENKDKFCFDDFVAIWETNEKINY